MILIFTSEDKNDVTNRSVLKMLPLGAEIIKTHKSIGELNLLLDYINIADWRNEDGKCR